MNKTKIDYCDSTWNPVTGCLHGCEYCYARSMVHRFSTQTAKPNGEIHDLKKRVNTPYPYGFDPTFHRYRLDEYANKSGRTIFVCSMADLFGDWVPDEWIDEVFKACEAAPQHTYLFLTKNPDRYDTGICSGILDYHKNFWLGTTVTTYEEINNLSRIESSVYLRFLSIEPLNDGKYFYPNKFLSGYSEWVEWVIIGAETGNRKNKIIPRKSSIEILVNECRERGIPVFMKSSLAGIWGETLIQEYPWKGITI